MWRKKTEHPSGGESSESVETNSGRVSGVQCPQERDPSAIQQRGRGGGRGYQGERGTVGQSQRGHRRYGGRGYHPQGHGRSQSQGIAYSCSISDYHGSEAQVQGTTFTLHCGGPMLESGRRGRGGDGEAGSLSHGASRLSTPELYQATQAQDQGNETPAESSLHLRSLPDQPLELSLLAARQQFEHLSVGASSNTTQPVGSSRDSTRFSLHAGKGNNGVKCLVKANYFYTELQDKDLHHYDVSITPEVTSRRVNRLVMKQLVELYRDSQLGSRLPAYDGDKNLYAAGPLPFTSQEFSITLVDDYDDTGGLRRESQFRVVIKLVARIGLNHSGLFPHKKQANVPQEVNFLDTVLRQCPTSRSTLFPVGRSFYSPDFGRQSIGEGVEMWHGFHQSIRPTQMGLSLNVDMSSSAFIEPLPVIDFVTCLLKGNVLDRLLSDADRFKIKKALKGVKVEVTHRGNMRKKYRISGLTSNQTSELTFSVAGGVMKSLVQYFRETYGVVIQHTSWPCLLVGNQQKPQYLPMEVCKIVKGQRYINKLNERQIQNFLKASCHRPLDLESNISEMVCDVRHNADHRDIYAEEFGVKISEQLASVEARILPAPWLKYHDTGKEKQCLPEFGQWNMKNKKLVNGGTVKNWTCINFSQNVQDSVARRFCCELAQTCCIFGMVFNLKPILPTYHARPDELKVALMTVHKDAMIKLQPQHKALDLVIVILPDHNGFLYGDLKRICETDLGLVSQCCLAKNVFKMNRQYLSNIVLKINVKVGGRNTVLVDALSRSIPRVTDRPTIIFGADVTHPHAGDDSSPSIAAVVASQDWPEASKYAGLVCAQAHRQEIIADLYKEWKDPVGGTVTGGMVKEHLMSFSKETGRLPERIIFYRDGIGEGQFGQVLYHELQSIRKACASLQQDYQPRVTFVVIQKHNHTRLFANDHLDRRAGNGSGNVSPGTVVDSQICHPTEFDFYLCSHAAIRGTSRPAHYHVLWDENEFTADELQSFTNNLCYTYARCTHSVSIVPPAYYAHLAAYRARCYMEPETFEVGSSASGAACSGSGPVSSGAHNSALNPGANYTVTRLPGEGVAVKRLPEIKENVKRVMFYC